jgi:hypothetical protein
MAVTTLVCDQAGSVNKPVGGPAFDAAAITTAWASAIAAQYVATSAYTVSSGRQTIVQALVAGLVTDGVWGKLDRFTLLANEDSTGVEYTSRTDLVNPTKYTSPAGFTGPTFTADRGYTGIDADPADAASLITNFNPATDGVQFQPNSCHISVWVRTSIGSPTNGIAPIGNEHSQIIIDNPFDPDMYMRINDTASEDSGTLGPAPAGQIGHWVVSRTAASGTGASRAYQSGVLRGSPDWPANSTLENSEIFLGCLNLSGPRFGCANQLSAWSAGGGLTATDVTNFYTRLQTYMTAIGA